MQPLSPATLQAPTSMLEKTPALLEILLRDLPEDTLQWKPAPDRWSINEVLGHLVAIERLYEQRARRIVLEDSPALPKYQPTPGDEPPKKSTRQYIDEFVPLRRAFVIYLHSVPGSAAARTGLHYEMGLISLSQMLHELANHDLGHLRQIAELYRAYSFYPHGGPFQRYSNLKP
ncbi:MAG TPA: DinB family protein [Verrucomicrobiae bacterium]|nr:DinB family protein [Verrucomicrobiae bacterium]